MKKSEIMRMANMLIDALASCDSEYFVDDVVGAVAAACCFDEEEIEDMEEAEE